MAACPRSRVSGAEIWICGRACRPYPMTENPPSTGIAAPVTKFEALEARKTAIPAKSALAPHRAAGVRANTRSCRPSISSRARRVRSVSIQPGSTALNVVGGPGDRAGARELHDAAFARGVSGCKTGAENRHHRADIDDLAAARGFQDGVDGLRAQHKALVRLVRSTRSHSSSSIVCGGFRILMPALLTRISIRPSARTVRSTIAVTAALSVTSALTEIALTPTA
jgi:hypothetical protein